MQQKKTTICTQTLKFSYISHLSDKLLLVCVFLCQVCDFPPQSFIIPERIIEHINLKFFVGKKIQGNQSQLIVRIYQK